MPGGWRCETHINKTSITAGQRAISVGDGQVVLPRQSRFVVNAEENHPCRPAAD
jgi:hypothetical protein